MSLTPKQLQTHGWVVSNVATDALVLNSLYKTKVGSQIFGFVPDCYCTRPSVPTVLMKYLLHLISSIQKYYIYSEHNEQLLKKNCLTHWGRMTHICVIRLTIIGSDNGLSPDRRQAIIWTNAGLLLIGPLGTNFSEILIEILTFSFKKMHLKASSAKRRPFCLGLNVLRVKCYKGLNVPKW